MNRGFLQTISFRRIHLHLSAFRYTLIKNGFAGLKTLGVFEQRPPDLLTGTNLPEIRISLANVDTHTKKKRLSKIRIFHDIRNLCESSYDERQKILVYKHRKTPKRQRNKDGGD